MTAAQAIRRLGRILRYLDAGKFRFADAETRAAMRADIEEELDYYIEELLHSNPVIFVEHPDGTWGPS
jgi:hypothetical protein